MAIVVQLTEAQWQDQVTQYAQLRGWSWMHVLRAFAKGRWLTNTQGPLGKGWPDLILTRGDRILAVELKAASGTLSEAQRTVLNALAGAGVETYVWRPQHIALMMEILA